MQEQIVTNQTNEMIEEEMVYDVTRLPSSWTVVLLGNDSIFHISSGGTPDRLAPEYFRGNIKWVKSGELKDNIIYTTEETISSLGLERSSAKLFHAGTLLVAMYGATAGMTALLGVEAAVNQAICAIVPQSNSVDNRFLQFFFIKNRQKILDARSGGAQPNINQRVIRSLAVILPPLPEQRAIAHILQTVQNAIQTRRKELELERERKAALMQHLFTRGTQGGATKQTEIGEIPESWQLVNLENLCNGNFGLIQTGPFGSQLHASDYIENGIPVVNPTHLGINTIVEDYLPKIDRKDADRLAKHYLHKGDILISRRGDFSRYSYITERQSGWLCGTGCLLIRLDNPIINNRFLSISIGSELVQQYLAQNATGLIMPNLNTKILERLPIAFPAIHDQEVIAQTIDACDSKIAVLEKEIALQEELFRVLLEELMSGRLSALPLVE